MARPTSRHGRLAVAAVVCLALALPAACTDDGHPSPQPGTTPAAGQQPTADDATFASTLTSYLAAWTALWRSPDDQNALSAVAGLTGDKDFAMRVADVGSTMKVTGVTLSEIRGHGPQCRTSSRCRQDVDVKVDLEGLGSAHWTSSVGAIKSEEGWEVLPDPESMHPDLSDDTRLRRVRELPARAPILDRAGKPLMWSHPVVHVGLEQGRATKASARTLARLVGVEAKGLIDRLEGAGSHQFVEAIVLRKEAYRQIATRVGRVKGVVLREGTRALAPDSAFGRGVLGTVEPATAETLKNAGAGFEAADEVGTFGLQAKYQRRLAGTPRVAVRIVDPADGHVVATIAKAGGDRGQALRTTLQLKAQEAAETALSAAPANARASLVAVQASSGEVLAAANGPGPQNENRAFTGHYAPGSTFKIVSASALLRSGMTPGSPVDCVDRIVVDGASFGNYDALLAPGRTTLAHAVSLSCNTALIGERNRVSGDALPSMAADYGIGGDWSLPVVSYSGSVPEPVGATELAASMIGQGRITASPLAMAEAAAAVSTGRSKTPTLIAGAAHKTGARVGVARKMRTILHDTATNGTARVLAGLADGAKTGTAETGATRGATNAWMVGYTHDVAFAVIVEGGSSGASVAGPVAKRFLQEYR